MNLPNKLTVLRVCMVPVFVVLMLTACSVRSWSENWESMGATGFGDGGARKDTAEMVIMELTKK